MEDINRITHDVIDLSIRIHRDLGPGLLESVYEMVLASRLEAAGYGVRRQHPVAIDFEGTRFEAAFRVDILVADRLVVEIKSVERLSKVHAKQVLTYLRLMKQPVGLLVNFGGETLKEGVRRLVNNYVPSASSAPLREIK
ncbi:GxxExxY protein [Sphingomonas sp.]|uniref:GxxExxY protein n=1 Tax=Sphingomonas sp. TaxID=28214 RepID=UPI002DD6B59F|nr:GxxExxY protein [Sphingomonas sp.]